MIFKDNTNSGQTDGQNW